MDASVGDRPVDAGGWLVHDNQQRPHQEYRSLGRTPVNNIEEYLAAPLNHRRISLVAQGLLSALLALFAAALWVISLRGVEIDGMTDLGLGPLLPLPAALALVILTASYCLAFRQQSPSTMVLVWHIGVLVFMLYGVTALVETVPRFAVSWRHLGVTEYVMRNGSVDPTIDAYFSWPGFFILSALVTQAVRLRSLADYLPWVSVFFQLLYLGPLVMIFRRATRDERLVWLSVWFFYLTNWIGQDYFSPQGFSYFFYLVMLAVLLTWFESNWKPPLSAGRGHRFPWLTRLTRLVVPVREDAAIAPTWPWQRAGLLGVVILVFLVTVSSHQLTPFAMLAAVTTLVALNRLPQRGLPVLMAVLIGAWLLFVATVFVKGHIGALVGSIGQVGDLVEANVGDRLQGSPGHLLILRTRLLITVIVLSLAALGGIVRLRSGYRDLSFALLAATPFALVLLQRYGGEMLLRAYLFSLPFLAFFAAAFYWGGSRRAPSGRDAVAVGMATLALLGGFFLARYGNERMDYFTANELEATRYLYSHARPGSVLASASSSLPIKYERYEQYHHRLVTDEVLEGRLDEIVRSLPDPDRVSSYLILSRSQKAHLEMFYGVAPDFWARLESDIMGTGRFRVLFENRDATVYELVSVQREKRR